jgi:DNA-binding MurR/RpiR family transcriptional regulator
LADYTKFLTPSVVRKNISPTVRLRHAQERASFCDMVRWEMRNLASVLKLNSEDSIQQAAKMLANAPNIHVLGLRSSFAPAYSLAFYLQQVRQVMLMDLSAGYLSEQAKRFRNDDLVVIFSFPPVCAGKAFSWSRSRKPPGVIC